jgi:hypothetical protein
LEAPKENAPALMSGNAGAFILTTHPSLSRKEFWEKEFRDSLGFGESKNGGTHGWHMEGKSPAYSLSFPHHSSTPLSHASPPHLSACVFRTILDVIPILFGHRRNGVQNGSE